jgi:hypothetical protein
MQGYFIYTMATANGTIHLFSIQTAYFRLILFPLPFPLALFVVASLCLLFDGAEFSSGSVSSLFESMAA